MDITIEHERKVRADVRALLEASDDYHARLYPAESNHLVDTDSLEAPSTRLLVARTPAGDAVGCGAVLLHGQQAAAFAELKRMWVVPHARGHGLGRRLIEALETAAREEGITCIRLETGIHQPEAIQLYRAQGYQPCRPFASYRADPLSLFMEKHLTID